MRCYARDELTTESRGVKARQIMSADDVRRALVRIGHEIVERHGGTITIEGDDAAPGARFVVLLPAAR